LIGTPNHGLVAASIFYFDFRLCYDVAVSQATEFFVEKSILITGASSGIGAELASQLAQLGSRLTLAARRRDRLELLAEKAVGAGKSRPVIVDCDVTREGDPERAVTEALRAHGKLDVVFANAGFGVVAPLKKLTIDDYRRQFETNVFGVLRTIYAALPALEKSHGHLAIMGSVAGWVSTPGASPYSMSKFALRALADAVTPEFRSSGITVTLISPGFVDSDIRRIDNRGVLRPQAKDPIPPRLIVPTPKAVREILAAVARGERERVVTGHGKILVAIARFAPWILRTAVARASAIRTKDDTRNWEE